MIVCILTIEIFYQINYVCEKLKAMFLKRFELFTPAYQGTNLGMKNGLLVFIFWQKSWQIKWLITRRNDQSNFSKGLRIRLYQKESDIDQCFLSYPTPFLKERLIKNEFITMREKRQSFGCPIIFTYYAWCMGIITVQKWHDLAFRKMPFQEKGVEKSQFLERLVPPNTS